jgi:hypothetical protein
VRIDRVQPERPVSVATYRCLHVREATLARLVG